MLSPTSYPHDTHPITLVYKPHYVNRCFGPYGSKYSCSGLVLPQFTRGETRGTLATDQVGPHVCLLTLQALVLMAASLGDTSHRRREKRRQLDARRSKCRIRLGGHMEQWCLLKEQLGFSLHSQLAKFLLDRLGAGSRALGEGT